MKQFEELDKRMALLEQKLDLVLDNHLSHMEKDLAMIKKFLGVVTLAVFTLLMNVAFGLLGG